MGVANVTFGYISTPTTGGSMHAGLALQTKTASARLSVVSGNVGTGIRVSLTDTATRTGNLVNTATPAISTVTRTLAVDGNVRCAVSIAGAVGTFVDGVVCIQGLQLEDGPARTVIVPVDFRHGSLDHWAEYRLNLSRPITIEQAAMVRRIAEGVAPARSRLKLMTYPAAQHLRNGAVKYDATYTHGAA
jgi:hypothetical protein